MQRFHSLDGLRGVAAVCVALMHFPLLNRVTDSVFISNAYLFVDLFFVISGYVIAGNVIQRNSFKDFISRRLKRLLPIYYFTLFISVSLEALLYFFPGLSQREAFSGVTGWRALLSELSLVHAFPFVLNTSFNPPNWSISTEIFLYVALGLSVFYLRSNVILWGLALATFFISNFMLLSEHWNNAHELAIYRGVAGFSAGFMIFHIRDYMENYRFKINSGVVDFFVLIVILYIYLDGTQSLYENSILFPSLIFGLLIFFLTTSESSSFTHSILTNKIFVWLGVLSYPLYLLHYFVGHRIEDLCALADARSCLEYGELFLVFYIGLCLALAQILLAVTNSIFGGKR